MMPITIPPRLEKTMKQYPNVKWNQIVKEAIQVHLGKLEMEKEEWRKLGTYSRRKWVDADELIHY